MKLDHEAIRREIEAERLRFEAFPEPTEDTVDACIAALRAEGCPEPTVSGQPMTYEQAVAAGHMPLEDLRSLLHDWRYLKTLPPKEK